MRIIHENHYLRGEGGGSGNLIKSKENGEKEVVFGINFWIRNRDGMVCQLAD